MSEYLLRMWELAVAGEVQGIFFYAAVYAVLVLALSLRYQLRVAAWPAVRGRLIDARVRALGATEIVLVNRDYLASTRYEYTVDGTTYQGNRLSPWQIVATHNLRVLLRKQLQRIDSDPDGGVTVYYDPKNPRKSFLVKPGRAGIAFTAALAVGIALLYWFRYHA